MEDKPKKLNPFAWDYGAWRKFFAVSGCWNMIGAIPAVISPRLNLKLMYGLSTNDYYNLMLNRSLWIAILIFGVGYFLIALDPRRYFGIIVMGIIGKIAVAVIWFHMFSIGTATFMAAFAATGDSIFTVFFILYIVLEKKIENSPAS